MRKGPYIFWSVFIAAAAFRVTASFYRVSPDASLCVGHEITGSGIVSSDAERKDSGQVLIIAARELFATSTVGKPCAENIQIRVKTNLYPTFSYGDQVSVDGKLSKPFNFKSDNGRSFDYRGYLAKDDVYYEMKSAKIVAVSQTDRLSIVDRITSLLFKIKHRFVSNLERALGEPHAALAAGLVVGEKSALGAGLLNDFRIVGLIHIVVLSGFNITIVGVALRKMLSFLPRVWGIIFGAAGIILFGVLVGGGATVVRSCFMAGIALSADLIRRSYNVSRALAFAAFVMLIQNPLILLHDPSFQLSFLATMGLILLASPIEEKLKFLPEKFGIRGTVASSFATQIFVSPFILWTMGQISIIGVVVNILVLPFIPLTMLAVFVTGALGFIYAPISIVSGWLTHLLLSYELFMVEKFAHIPHAAAYVPPFSFWWVVGFYGVFFVGFVYRNKSKKNA